MQKLPEWFALQHAKGATGGGKRNNTAGDANNGSGIAWILKDAVSNRGDGLHMLETEEDVHNVSRPFLPCASWTV